MAEARYLTDSSVRRFEARVERTLDDRVALDGTHFYPEGGGQPADRGTVSTEDGRWRVVSVQKRDAIYHTLEPVDGTVGLPEEGATVTGELDWERRAAHMRYHTAQHLLSAVLLDQFDAPTVGNQLYADRARIDAGYERFTPEDLERVETRMNDIVGRDLAVTWYTTDRAEAEATLDSERTRIDLLPESITDLRIVEIAGEDGADDPFDRTACAGTHVTTTADLGRFRVTGRSTQGREAERLSFVLE
ncbi:alanyl-tRNA editing protein [Halomarina litorea]|uniref:alanyl-tRNA editing protein n=1 Tax=Halomarina litorea TaxID=2961595 RepID=UPI0020C3AA99|nr:alanyl-tRNA editing protein [Halomarina sp. BCD28]